MKNIADDFIANMVVVIGHEKYNIGHISLPKKIQRSNMHNQRLLTWEVSFTLTHTVHCTLEENKIDLGALPNTLQETDIERVGNE